MEPISRIFCMVPTLNPVRSPGIILSNSTFLYGFSAGMNFLWSFNSSAPDITIPYPSTPWHQLKRTRHTSVMMVRREAGQKWGLDIHGMSLSEPEAKITCMCSMDMILTETETQISPFGDRLMDRGISETSARCFTEPMGTSLFQGIITETELQISPFGDPRTAYGT